jgi:aryl-alcohol dehydrogenase-like predicted oxidoreductase
MEYVQLGASGIRSSVLGFGCSAVMGRVGRKGSLCALGAAYDSGITFFDTARSYGYGEAEAALGEFLVGRRDRVVVSTKFGIMPVYQQAWKQAVKPLARRVFSLFPSAKTAMESQIAAQFQPNQFTVELLHRSLEESLRKLRTDYVDLLFMHTPPASALGNRELLHELGKLVQAGKVRVLGVSATLGVIGSESVRERKELQALQFPCNMLNLHHARRIAKERADERILVANHPFGGVDGVANTRSWLGQLAGAVDVASTLREKFRDASDGLLADVVLNLVTRKTGIHVVVSSMMQAGHVRNNAAAITHSRFSEDEIQWIRDTFCRS